MPGPGLELRTLSSKADVLTTTLPHLFFLDLVKIFKNTFGRLVHHSLPWTLCPYTPAHYIVISSCSDVHKKLFIAQGLNKDEILFLVYTIVVYSRLFKFYMFILVSITHYIILSI